MKAKELTYEERLAARNEYEHAAALWVARYNKTHGVHENLCDADRITDVTFAHVGAYHYSEMTYDYGDAGLTYTFWEEHTFASGKRKGETVMRPVEFMDIRLPVGIGAGQFISECVELLGAA